MPLHLLAAVAAVVGGLVWMARWLAEGPVVMHWIGLGFLGVALAAVGSGLVSSVAALRVVAGLGLALLVLSLVELVRPASDAALFDGVLGIVAVVAGAIALIGVRGATRRAAVPQGRRRAG
jgi:hypothetical protein